MKTTIEMAKEAGFAVAQGSYGLKFSGGDLEKFARIVATEEREACASIVSGAAAGFCGGNAETVMRTVAKTIRDRK